jgi:WD40 repeat protein
MTRSASSWEIRSNGDGLRLVFADWGTNNVPMGWTTDDRFGIFASEGTFWVRPQARVSLMRNVGPPDQFLTDAPDFNSSVRLRHADFFYAIGTDRLGELQRYDSRSEKWIPVLDGISAEAAEYSRDGKRIVYVTYPQRSLWVRQADGSKPIQLTSLPFTAFSPRWSADGRRISFNAQDAPDKPIRLFSVDSEGGVVRPVLPSEPGSQGYSTWSPDGEKLLYGMTGSSTRESVYIRVVDLRASKLSKLEGSDGLYGPRWSPDGSMIAALQWGPAHHLMIYHVREKRWEEVPGLKVDWPTWTPDSRSILFQSADALMQYRIATRKFEAVTKLKTEEIGGFIHSLGVAADGSPLRTLKRDSQQIYELRFRRK